MLLLRSRRKTMRNIYIELQVNDEIMEKVEKEDSNWTNNARSIQGIKNLCELIEKYGG